MQTYGIIGYPLAHSCSPKYFNERFRTAGIDATYLSFEIREIRELENILQCYPDLQGFNVTIPHKQNILPFLDEISEEAREIGAVNCVKVTRRNNRPYLKGYNTDVYGFRTALLRFIPQNLIKKALILGNGGAAKAVRYALYTLDITTVTVSRTPQGEDETGYPETGKYLTDHLLVVNTTPLGTWPNTEGYPDLPYHLLTGQHYLFDLVYNPEVTAFMKHGRENGAHVSNGYGMWLGQAEKNWEIWECEK